MSAAVATVLVVVLLVGALAAGAAAWRETWRPVMAPACAALLGVSALLAALAPDLDDGRTPTTGVVLVTALLAATGGGPVTTWVFALVDRRDDRNDVDGAADLGRLLERAGEVLRGGAWIGVLERLAVYAGLAAGFPEGVAIVLALKGVGRYPDLRTADHGSAGEASGTTERFIIGTFASVLWAAACAGMVALTRR